MIRSTLKYNIILLTAALFLTTPISMAATAKVNWSDFKEGVSRAKSENKPMYVDFYATWCPPCKMMEQSTFVDPNVVNALNNQFVAIKIDVDKHQELALKYGARAIPHHVVMTPAGEILHQFKGAIPAEMFLKILNQSISGAQ